MKIDPFDYLDDDDFEFKSKKKNKIKKMKNGRMDGKSKGKRSPRSSEEYDF